jgi:hypothetical protein
LLRSPFAPRDGYRIVDPARRAKLVSSVPNEARAEAGEF